MKKLLVLLLTALLLGGCGSRDKIAKDSGEKNRETPASAASKPDAAEPVSYETTKWIELMSPDEQSYYARVEAEYEKNPDFVPSDTPPEAGVNPEMDGRRIRIPGYVVGIDSDPNNFTKVSTFLFVPWQGACIHVPPPPPNLTILTKAERAVESNPYIPYWISGTILIEGGANDLATFYYTFQADRIEAVQE